MGSLTFLFLYSSVGDLPQTASACFTIALSPSSILQLSPKKDTSQCSKKKVMGFSLGFLRWHETVASEQLPVLCPKSFRIKAGWFYLRNLELKREFREGKITRTQQAVDQASEGGLVLMMLKAKFITLLPVFLLCLLWKCTSLNILFCVESGTLQAAAKSSPTFAPSLTEAHVSARRRAGDWPQTCGSLLSSQKAVAQGLWRSIEGGCYFFFFFTAVSARHLDTHRREAESDAVKLRACVRWFHRLFIRSPQAFIVSCWRLVWRWSRALLIIDSVFFFFL